MIVGTYRVNLTLDQLNTLMTAANVRLRELANLVEMAKYSPYPNELRFAQEKYADLKRCLDALEDAEYTVTIRRDR